MQSDPDDPLAEYRSAQRGRRGLALAVALAVLLMLAGGWAWWRATGLPPLDPEIERDVREAMDGLNVMPDELHASLAAAAMAELEVDRLPAAMIDAFEAAQAAPPGMASQLILAAIADDPDSLRGWTVACPAGARAISDVVQTNDIDKLFADCSLGRWSLIDGTAARRLGAGRLILAHAAWGWLVDHHAETELERRVLRVFVQG
jgi:hypothetical protein